MYQFPIGVILDSFRVDVYTALDKAVKVGAQGLQVYATPKAAERYGIDSPEGRKAFLRMEND